MRGRVLPPLMAALLVAASALGRPAMAQPQAAVLAGVDAVALRHAAAGIDAPREGLVGAIEGWLGYGAWRVHLGYGEGVLTAGGAPHALAEGIAALGVRVHRGVEVWLGPRAIAVGRDDVVHRWVAWHGALRMELPLAVPDLRAVAEVWGGPGALSLDATATQGRPDFASGGSAGLAWRAVRFEYVITTSRAGDRDAFVIERIRLRAQLAARGPPRAARRTDGRDGGSR